MDARIDLLPKSSILDLEEGSEGSLDPLGLAGLSDELASRLASDGVRERQSNIRFLTFCCVGWTVIAAIDSEIKPGDRDSTLEQAFEWIVLESLVDPALDISGEEQRMRIPGILKARDCVARDLHLNADRYLRTPGTFGFFGVYRGLALYLRIVAETGDGRRIMRLNGERILEAWRRDNEIPGFGEDGNGPGRDEFRSFVRSLSDTWALGMAEIRPETKRFIAERLSPSAKPGRREREALWSALNGEGVQARDDNRRLLMSYLLDPKVQAIFEDDMPGVERRFHRLLRKKAQGNLAIVLDAIERFEIFAGYLMDSFDELRRRLSTETRLVELAPLAESDPAIREAAVKTSAAYLAAESALYPLGLSERFSQSFGDFSLSQDPVRFADSLVKHHQRIQKNKPPVGKASWFETDRSKIGLRPLYRLSSETREPKDYLYAYRARTLYRFVSAVGSRDS